MPTSFLFVASGGCYIAMKPKHAADAFLEAGKAKTMSDTDVMVVSVSYGVFLAVPVPPSQIFPPYVQLAHTSPQGVR